MTSLEEQISRETGIFLERRRSWSLRTIRFPERPEIGDRGPVRDALMEVVDAAGAVEFSRQEFSRVASIGQKEFEEAEQELKKLGSGSPSKKLERCDDTRRLLRVSEYRQLDEDRKGPL